MFQIILGSSVSQKLCISILLQSAIEYLSTAPCDKTVEVKAKWSIIYDTMYSKKLESLVSVLKWNLVMRC